MLALNKAMIHTVATIVTLTAGKHLDDVRWWLGEMFRSLNMTMIYMDIQRDSMSCGPHLRFLDDYPRAQP